MKKADGPRKLRPSILIFSFPEYSALNGSVAIARGLAASGMNVVFFVPEKFRSLVSMAGFECVVPENATPELSCGNKGHISRLIAETRAGVYKYSTACRNLESILKKRRFHLVLLHTLCWQIAPVFLAANVPIVSLNSSLAGGNKSGVPPVFSPRIPRRKRFLDTIENRIDWLALGTKNFVRDFIRSIWLSAVIGNRRYKEISPRRQMRQLGRGLTEDEYGRKYSAVEIVMCPKEFDFPENTADTNRCYAGACVDFHTPSLNSFNWAKIDAKKRLVYCSLGTYSAQYPEAKRFFKTLIEAFGIRRDIQAIINIGESSICQELGPVPGNVLLAEWVPQLEILARASAFISHGGLGSVRESLVQGVPMLVFPCWYDQAGNSARVVFHKLGLRSKINITDKGRILYLLERTMEDCSIRESVKSMQRNFRNQMKCEAATELVEKELIGVRMHD